MTWERYANANPTGLRVESWLGSVANFRSYCDDPDLGPVGIYVSKEPVCKLKMTPRVQFINTNIAWDISQSRSTTGTIDTFDIDWGGTTDIGDLTAQDWATDPKTGNVQYTTVGEYTVTAYVTDLLGQRSKEAQVEIRIVVPVERVYIGTTNNGVYLMDNGDTPAASNSGLTGDSLKLRAIRLNPHTKENPADKQHIWLATAAGLAYSKNGGSTWTVITKADMGTPVNTAGDVTPPATADLDQIDLCFDPQSDKRIYVLRTTATRAWLYYTDDYGGTWSNSQVGV